MLQGHSKCSCSLTGGRRWIICPFDFSTVRSEKQMNWFKNITFRASGSNTNPNPWVKLVSTYKSPLPPFANLCALSLSVSLHRLSRNSSVRKPKRKTKICEPSKRQGDSLALSSLPLLLIRASHLACYRHPTATVTSPTPVATNVCYASLGPSVNSVGSKSTLLR